MFTTYIRKPFMLSACQLTEENLEELGVVKTTTTGRKYILVGNSRAYVGDWITQRFGKRQVFQQKAFGLRFVEYTQELSDLLDSHGLADETLREKYNDD